MQDNTPWPEWRALAFLQLRWRPADFWAATPHDLWAALQGRALLKAGLTTAAIADLKAKLKDLNA